MINYKIYYKKCQAFDDWIQGIGLIFLKNPKGSPNEVGQDLAPIYLMSYTKKS